MILGIGTDLVDVRRIERVFKKFPTAFPQRISSSQEAAENTSSSLLLAKRFASKEACSKALGVGIGSFLSFQNMTLKNGRKGPPEINLDPWIIPQIWPDLFLEKIRLDLSLSDEYPYVQAFVVISRL